MKKIISMALAVMVAVAFPSFVSEGEGSLESNTFRQTFTDGEEIEALVEKLEIPISAGAISEISIVHGTDNSSTSSNVDNMLLLNVPSKRTFTDEAEIAALTESLGIPMNADEIAEISIVQCADEPISYGGIDSGISPHLGNDIVFRNVTVGLKLGDEIRHMTFAYPGGTMEVAETTTSTFRSDVEVSSEIIKIGFGVDISESISVSGTQIVEVTEEGKSSTCYAYYENRHYDFEIYEDDLFFDDYLGTGTLDVPVGIIFVVSRNITPLPIG
ncbi:MAG: hypothetical protein ACI4SS_03975 [Clostridia bacterium]